MNGTFWRKRAAPIITEVIRNAESRGLSAYELSLALFNAYPFGEMHGQPYRVWCEEIRRQTGARQKQGSATPSSPGQLSLEPVVPEPSDQHNLFDQ